MPLGILEENAGAGGTSSHPLLLPLLVKQESIPVPRGKTCLRAALDQRSNAASRRVSLWTSRQVRDHRAHERGDTGHRGASKKAVRSPNGNGVAEHPKGMHGSCSAKPQGTATHNANVQLRSASLARHQRLWELAEHSVPRFSPASQLSLQTEPKGTNTTRLLILL